MTFTDDDLRLTLRRYWGYPDFRPAQAEIIRSVLSGNDTIGLLPTGGGKSITFQVPAMLLDGLTLVITPLISLMKDQVDNLAQRGVRAVYLHSGLTLRESNLALDRCRLHKARMLYVSPEKLQSKRFIDQLRFLDISLIVVDEAHCISQWGYDFRPSYLRIADLRRIFPSVPVLALTASATPDVIRDIADKLAMKRHNTFRLSFDRDNISYIVRQSDFKEGKIIDILNRMGGTAIVYVRSRRRSRELADALCKAGIRSEFYHAGLLAQEKEERQNRWKEGTTRVIVATNAFGMGIDKPDVRLVIHHDIPSSLEEYYQEAGRAARDGKPSYAVLLVSNHDKTLLSRRLADAFPEKDTIRRVYELVGNFLDIAVGEGYGTLHEFNINLFCTRFKFMPAVVHNSLSILTQAGYIDYNEELSTRSRLMMLMTREDLYGLRLQPEPERVLQHILRTSTGIFADYEIINEPLIASNLGLTEETVYQALLLLSRLHVVHYVPRKTSSFILYTTARELPRHLLFPAEVYERRRQRMAARIEAMKKFAFSSDDCRVNVMLRYFGEEPSKPCGKCDVCRSAAPRPAAASSLRDTIIYILSHPGAHTINSLISQIPAPSSSVIETVRSLSDCRLISIDGDRLTLL